MSSILIAENESVSDSQHALPIKRITKTLFPRRPSFWNSPMFKTLLMEYNTYLWVLFQGKPNETLKYGIPLFSIDRSRLKIRTCFRNISYRNYSVIWMLITRIIPLKMMNYIHISKTRNKTTTSGRYI